MPAPAWGLTSADQRRLLELELSALEQKQQVEIIASPRLLASHMQPASIKQGVKSLSGLQRRKRRHVGGV
jgi:type II secretory pathway component HofQ